MGARNIDRNADARAEPRALVVDDDALMCEVIELYLNDCGVQCQHANTLKAAIEALEQKTYDLVITDFQLGGESGSALIHQLRGMAIDQPVVIGMSKHTSVEERHAALSAGMDEFLDKPIHAEDIELMISRFFAASSRVDQNLTPPGPTSPNTDSMPPFLDTDRALELHRQSGHLKGYLSTYAASCAFIRHHILVARQQHNLTKVGQLIHRLTGAAAILGDSSICSKCKQLKQVLEHRTDTSVQQDLVTLESMLARRIEDIQHYLGDHEDTAEPDVSSTEAIDSVTQRLRDTLAQHRVPGEKDVLVAVEHLRDRGQTTAADSFKLAIDQYDLLRAEQVLSIALRG